MLASGDPAPRGILAHKPMEESSVRARPTLLPQKKTSKEFSLLATFPMERVTGLEPADTSLGSWGLTTWRHPRMCYQSYRFAPQMQGCRSAHAQDNLKGSGETASPSSWLSPSCPSQQRQGRQSRCTHRRMPEISSSDHDLSATGTQGATALPT